MRIIHISDVHIRNFKYHKEYRSAFRSLANRLKELKPDLIINTGDTVHAKTQITPELVDMLSEHIITIANIAPYRMILGNHDLNLKNLDRKDAVSPVVESLKKSGVDVDLWRDVGPYDVKYKNGNGASLDCFFWVFPIDSEKKPSVEQIAKMRNYKPDFPQICLFHGAISGCSTDSEWTMDSLEHDVSMFKDFDYVMMGDIHKHQSWRNGRVCYAGSLIQQNFGESQDKGFLIWDIVDKDKFSVKHEKLIWDENKLSFHTVDLDETLLLDESIEIPNNSYVRVRTVGSYTASEQRQIVSFIKSKGAKDVMVIKPFDSSAKQTIKLTVGKDEIQVSEKENNDILLREYMKSMFLDENTVDTVIELDKNIRAEIESEDENNRGKCWKINKIAWSNFCQYGADNIIDMTKVNGVYGIFGQNNLGKSTIFELITQALFDKVTKDVSRNVDLVNDEKDILSIIMELSVDDNEYMIERKVERIKSNKSREWGKTSLDFYQIVDDEKVLLNGETRPETEKAIRQLLGGFEDFCLTSLSPQHQVSSLPGGGDLINCKDTDRRRILYRFLGLDSFEKRFSLARETLKSLVVPQQQADTFESDKNELEIKEKELVEVSKNVIDLDSSLIESEGKKAVVQSEIKRISDLLFDFKDKDSSSLEDLDHYKSSVEFAEKKIDRLQKDIESSEESIKELNEKCEHLPDNVEIPEDPTAKIRKVSNEISSLELSIAKLKERSESSKKKISILSDVPCGDNFPHCKFLIDAFAAKNELPAKVNEINSLELLLNDSRNELDSLRKYEKKWKEAVTEAANNENIRNQLARSKQKHELLQLHLKQAHSILQSANEELKNFVSFGDDIVKLNKLRLELTDIERMQKKARTNLVSFRTNEKNICSRITVLKEKISNFISFEKRRKEIEKHREILELYCKIVGKDGIPKSILVSALPSISKEVNQIISSISDIAVSLENNDDEQSLSLCVSSKNSRLRAISLSGGAEKFIVSLALRAALCRITSLPRSNMFIVDEGFGKLDTDNSSAIQKMFHYLKEMFDHVIIVSHTETMRDVVDGTIDIGIDKEGFAHISHL